MRKIPVVIGEVFGQLTVLEEDGGNLKVRCSCGTELSAVKGAIRSGNTTSCGCRRKTTMQKMLTTHGMREHPLYQTWADMRKRCYSPNSAAWEYYGGRGISICSAWGSFAQFVSDMGERPEGRTLERKDTNGNYSPENCVWATVATQNVNTRKSLRYLYAGQRLTIQELAAKAATHGVTIGTLRGRLNRGMSVELAVELPLQRVGWHPKPTDLRTTKSRKDIVNVYPTTV